MHEIKGRRSRRESDWEDTSYIDSHSSNMAWLRRVTMSILQDMMGIKRDEFQNILGSSETTKYWNRVYFSDMRDTKFSRSQREEPLFFSKTKASPQTIDWNQWESSSSTGAKGFTACQTVWNSCKEIIVITMYLRTSDVNGEGTPDNLLSSHHAYHCYVWHDVNVRRDTEADREIKEYHEGSRRVSRLQTSVECAQMSRRCPFDSCSSISCCEDEMHERKNQKI